MDTKSVIRPESSSLTDVLIPCTFLDEYIDNYRHDSGLNVEVTFMEYIQYLTLYLGNKKILYFPSVTLKNAVTTWVRDGNTRSFLYLYRAYILDVMTGAAKELSLAERRQQEATLISYVPFKNPILVEEGSFPEYNEEEADNFSRRMSVLGYHLMNEMHTANNGRILHYIYQSVKLAAALDFNEYYIFPPTSL